MLRAFSTKTSEVFLQKVDIFSKKVNLRGLLARHVND